MQRSQLNTWGSRLRRHVLSAASACVAVVALCAPGAAVSPAIAAHATAFGGEHAVARTGAGNNLVKLRRVARSLVAAGAPGAIVFVRTPSGTGSATAGFARLQPRVPMRAADHYRIGSVTKTFVATAVLQLVAEQKLSLDDSAIPPPVAHGYWSPNGKLTDLTPLLDPSLAYAAGQMTSTVADLAKFFAALLKGRLLPAALLKQMKASPPPQNGWVAGLGLLTTRTPCGVAFGHGGDIVGWHDEVLATADGRRVAVVMVNYDPARLEGKFAAAPAVLCSR